MCKLPKPPASRALCQAKRAPRAQSTLKQISLGCALEGFMLKLKLQYFGHLMRRVDSLEKTLMLVLLLLTGTSMCITSWCWDGMRCLLKSLWSRQRAGFHLAHQQTFQSFQPVSSEGSLPSPSGPHFFLPLILLEKSRCLSHLLCSCQVLC